MTTPQGTATTQWQIAPATPGQINYLRDLAGKHSLFGADLDIEATKARMEEQITGGLNGGQASALIDQAKASPVFPREIRPASDAAIRSLRWYAQDKAVFGLGYTREETIARVEETIAAGLTEKQASDLRYKFYTAKPHPTAKSPLPLSLIESIDGLTISEGHYAVLVEGVLRFYRVYAPATGEYKGVAVMKRFGGDNLFALYPGEAKAALTLIDADPDTAAFRFADEFTLCWVCGKTLTEPVSRLISVGPTCRGFTGHSGLKQAAAAVDADPTRRHVYRALRGWALGRGFTDPRNKEDRKSMNGQITASRLASAWSGLPGVLTLGTSDEVVALIQNALDGAISDTLRDALLAAPADTIEILLDSGVLTGPVMQILREHSSAKVREGAAQFFLSLLGG